MVIVEDLRRLGEADAVLLLILPSLLGIPFEYHHRAPNGNLTSELIGTQRHCAGRRTLTSTPWGASRRVFRVERRVRPHRRVSLCGVVVVFGISTPCALPRSRAEHSRSLAGTKVSPMKVRDGKRDPG